MLRIVQVGLGPLGLKMVNMAGSRNSENVVAAVDVDPAKIGKTLGDLGCDSFQDVVVYGSLGKALNEQKADVAILTTVSDMERIVGQVQRIVAHGISVVSTCEELSHPWDEAPNLADKIDRSAIHADVAVLGTGVNPGFLMDSLPAFLTGVCRDVEKVEVRRYQDAQHRRIPFQQKIGAGLSLEAYEVKRQTGTLRHVGLTESIQFIAHQLGWKLDRTEDILTPVVAKEEIRTAAMRIPAGHASGVRQVGQGYIGETEKITLVFQAAVGEPESYDEVRISGTPDIQSKIAGGVNGDVATCAITLNACHSIIKAPSGLRTMSDVPMVSCRS